MSRSCALPAVALYVSAESYMATILGGPIHGRKPKCLAPSRIDRLQRRLGQEWRSTSWSEGEILALSWACEMSALAEAIATARERILQVDFDQFLMIPPRSRMFSGISAWRSAAARCARSWLARTCTDIQRLRQYAYDTALRVAVLNEARTVHAAEIRAIGLARSRSIAILSCRTGPDARPKTRPR